MSQHDERCSDCPDLDGSGTLCCRIFDAAPETTTNPTQVNKKLGRKVEYMRGSTQRRLYQYIGDNTGWKYLKTVDANEAHRFLHGIDQMNDAAMPSFDEMLEAVAAKLKEDCETHMLHCTESEHYLWDMYRRTKEKGLMVTLPWR